jgi:two-component system NtrC family sensor kinase
MIKKYTWLACFLISLFSILVNAQSTKVDSIITSLRQSNKWNGLDSAVFNLAIARLANAVITDADIGRLEAEADRFINGDNEDISLFIRYNISHIISDVNKTLDYGKALDEKIQNSKSPNKELLTYNLLADLRVAFRNSTRLPEGLLYYNNWLIKFKELNDSTGIAVCSYVLSGFYSTIGLTDRGIYHLKKSLVYLDSSNYTTRNIFGLREYGGRDKWINNIALLGDFYSSKPDLDNGLKYTRLAYELRKKDIENNNNTYADDISYAANNLAYLYFLTNRLDSATYMVNLAYNLSKTTSKDMLPAIFQTWSLLELKKKNFGKADSLLVKSWEIIKEMDLPTSSTTGTLNPDYYRALIRIEQKKYAEAANFLISDIARVKNIRGELLRDYKLLGDVYDKMGNAVKSKESYKIFISLQGSLLADLNKYSAISFEAEQQVNDKELSISQLKNENKISSLTKNFSFGIIAFALLLLGVVYFRYKAKQKANTVLEKTLTNLKSTQTQLIQSEKMASLGELTAGIAHEIQNPLNFVNNFSEVSNELIDEMKEELKKGNYDDANEIADDVKQNLEKITHHGQRAADIVKGMLQHSSSSSGVKELTDINALCDEYLRLSYHGLRAKDKSFNASMKTDFDNSIGNINIIPQDIGRVILNLINNAFYAVDEKKKSGIENYEPTVSISTKKVDDKIEIRVTDNGNGIPQKVLDKIFQPFFTTKPTGQGTGLGLSLSYDIVKAHGGELKVETKEGDGTIFIIQLTTSKNNYES